MSASSSAMRTRIVSLLTGRSLSTSAVPHLPARLLGRRPGTPARPRTPIGRGSGFKTRAVCVRVAPGALCLIVRDPPGLAPRPRAVPGCAEPSHRAARDPPGPTAATCRSPGCDAACPVAAARDPSGPHSPRSPYRCAVVTEPVPHMTPEQFRQHGHEVVDWIADYWSRVGSLPVRSQVSPGEVRESLPAAPPEQGEPFSAVLADLDRVVLPGVTHWQHPGFFGYFPANTSGPSVLGDLVSAGLGVQGMSWVTSPAATELEQHVMDWLADLLGLPASFRSTATGGGVVQDSSSGANLVALLAALHRSSTGATVRHGVEPERATVYVSSETHSSMEKAVRIAGLGTDAVRIVEVDGDLAMRPAALAARIERDVARGYTPVLVCATVGTTSTTAIDPLAELGPICRKHGVWLHVDAAYAGVSAVVPELRGAAVRRRVGRQLHDRRPQVAADRLRRHPVLGRRPGRPHRRPVDPPRVPAQRRDRGRRRRRLPRLADPARPPFPCAQALVRAALVRRRGPARPHPLARGPRAGVRRLGRRRRAVRRRDGPSAVPGLPAAPLGGRRGRRRRHHDAARAAQRRRRGVRDPHQRGRAHRLRVAVGAPATTRAHVERLWALLREGHDWLAADFAAAAAERAAEQERARQAAEEERARAEAERAADLPAVEETALVLDETDAVSPSST